MSAAKHLLLVTALVCDPGQVRYPNGTVTEAIVPFACLMNHSCRPHVVEYGSLTTTADGHLQLDFKCCRPVAEGQQCFLS